MADKQKAIKIFRQESYDISQLKKKLLICGCSESGGQEAKILGLFEDWGVGLQCPSERCKKHWFLCAKCPSRQKMTLKRQVYDHWRKLHKAASNPDSTIPLSTMDSSTGQVCLVVENDDNHEESIVELPTTEEANDDEANMEMEDYEDVVQEIFDTENIPWEDVEEIHTFGFESGMNEKYFSHQHNNHGLFGGLEFLVKQSLIQRDLQPSEFMAMKMKLGDARLQMKIAKLLFLLSANVRQLLYEILEGVYETGCKNGMEYCTDETNKKFNNMFYPHNHSTKDLIATTVAPTYQHGIVTQTTTEWQIKIPTSEYDYRNHYNEFKFSIVRNMPYPTIFTDIPGHSYVSVVECIRHALAHPHGARLDTIDGNTHNTQVVRHLHESEHARRIYNNCLAHCEAQGSTKPLVSYLFFWSDDFEPNTFSKIGRGSVWVKTMTIGTRVDDDHCITNTYPIAVGRKGDSHEEVEKKIALAIAELNSQNFLSFYLGAAKKQVKIYFEIIATLQDQPERRGANYLMGGNGTYCARWGVSANLLRLYPRLKSCQACLKILETRFGEEQWTLPVPNCASCLNWDALYESCNALIPLPADYPTINNPLLDARIICINGTNQLKPFQITYTTLKQAVTAAHTGFVENAWTKENLDTFLRTEGVQTKFIQDVYDNAVNCKAYKLAKEGGGGRNNDQWLEVLETARQQDPTSYEMKEFPALWTRIGVELTTHVDSIMHLLFLGIVSTTLEKIQDWLTVQNQNAPFLKANSHFLTEFKKMTIDWIPILPYTKGKLGAWVSENYLAFSRIMLWYFQNIGKAMPTNDHLPPEGLPQNKWLVRHNKHWLKSRGLDTEGKAAELSMRVAEFMKATPIPPEIPQPARSEQDIQDTVTALTSLLECVMASEVCNDTTLKCAYAIRIFLSRFDYMDSTIRTEKAKPTVVSAFNFACLINLPNTMTNYGPLRNLWEGGPRGEGFLRIMKPAILKGLQTNFHFNLLKSLLTLKTFDNLLDATPMSTRRRSKDSLILSARKREFHMYTSAMEVFYKVNEKEHLKKVPVSVVLVGPFGDSAIFKVFAAAENYENVVEVHLKEGCITKKKFGLEYYEFNVDNNPDVMEWEKDIIADNVDLKLGFAILLPLMEVEDTDENRLFALVSSNWKSLTSNYSLKHLVD